MNENYTIQMTRLIEASPERLFEAWTDPALLVKWWGPAHVECTGASVDLRVGGRYHLDNQLPDGTVVRIEGTFEKIERPKELVYSWHIGPEAPLERVAVAFEARGSATLVSIVHERIISMPARDQHEGGWVGCLDGLGALMAAA